MRLQPIGSEEPVSVAGTSRPAVRPSRTFSVEIELDGRFSVCDEHLDALATFDPDYREFAEEMRARLTIRALAEERSR